MFLRFITNQFLSIFGILIDINNWYQTIQMFKLLKEESRDLWNNLGLNISPVGVLYGFATYQNDLSDRHYKEMITSRFDPISESLIMLGLTGLIDFKYEVIDETDDKVIFVIKFIPSFRNTTWINLLKLVVFTTIVTSLIIKYKSQITEMISIVYNFIF